MTTYASDISTQGHSQGDLHRRDERGGNREHLREQAGAVKEDLQALKEDAAAAASAAGDCIRSEADRVTEVARTGGEKAAEMHTSVCRTVSKHPTAAVLTTLGIGVVIGRLIGGR